MGVEVTAGKAGRSGGGGRQAAPHGALRHRHLPPARSKLPGLPSWRIRFFFLMPNTLRSLFVKIRLLRIHRLSKTLANHPTPVLEETDRQTVGKALGTGWCEMQQPCKAFPAPACYYKKRIM